MRGGVANWLHTEQTLPLQLGVGFTAWRRLMQSTEIRALDGRALLWADSISGWPDTAELGRRPNRGWNS